MRKFLKVSIFTLLAVFVFGNLLFFVVGSFQMRPAAYESSTGASQSDINSEDVFNESIDDIKEYSDEFGNAVNEIINSTEDKVEDNLTPPVITDIPVKISDSESENYERNLFGDGWVDVDNNGCSTRDDILARDLTEATFDNCKVMTGVLQDKYSGEVINHERGNSQVDIDHIVPLHYAWNHGADAWTPEQRVAFANDPSNLMAVSGSENKRKSDSGPANYLPSNTAYECEYSVNFLTVISNYDLTISNDDYQTALEACS